MFFSEPTYEPAPEDFLDGWALFGTDFTAHYITGTETHPTGTLLTAACGARQHMGRCEAISAPLFRCLDCLHSGDVPTEGVGHG